MTKIMKHIAMGAAAAALVLSVGATQAGATGFSINIGVATLSGDTDTAVTTWTDNQFAGGADQLFQESYYLQIGNGSINVITPTVFFSAGVNSVIAGYDTTGDGSCSTITNCDIYITHSLLPGDWSSQVAVASTSYVGQNVHIFTSSDYDLSGSPGDDHGRFIGSGRFIQFDGLTMLTWNISVGPSAFDITGFATDLNLANLQGRTSYDGDVVFATRTDGRSFSLDRTLTAVPEPASMVLFGTGLASLAGAARRRFAKKA